MVSISLSNTGSNYGFEFWCFRNVVKFQLSALTGSEPILIAQSWDSFLFIRNVIGFAADSCRIPRKLPVTNALCWFNPFQMFLLTLKGIAFTFPIPSLDWKVPGQLAVSQGPYFRQMTKTKLNSSFRLWQLYIHWFIIYVFTLRVNLWVFSVIR